MSENNNNCQNYLFPAFKYILSLMSMTYFIIMPKPLYPTEMRLQNSNISNQILYFNLFFIGQKIKYIHKQYILFAQLICFKN